MSSHAEILDVHKTESKFKLRPHLVPSTRTINIESRGPLRVSLKELFSAETLEILRKLGLLL